jgi:hypothetical protein
MTGKKRNNCKKQAFKMKTFETRTHSTLLKGSAYARYVFVSHRLSAGPDPDDSEEGGKAAVAAPYGTKSGLRNKNERRTTGETAANIASRNFGTVGGSEAVDDDGGAGKACRRGKVVAVTGRTR